MGDDKMLISRQSVKVLPIKTLSSYTPKPPSNKTTEIKTPTMKKRKASEDSNSSTKSVNIKNDVQNSVKKPKREIDETLMLNAKDQAAADKKLHKNYPRGARVFAIYGKEYFPAIVDGEDGLGRYNIFYTEDHSSKAIPKDGVFPLHFVAVNSNVTVIGEYDEHNERAIYQGKILSIPSIENVEEWHRGLFKIEVQNEEHPVPETREIEWVDIYFTEAQYKQGIKSLKHFTANHQENGVGSSRRPRGSTLPLPPPPSTAVSTPKSIPLPIPDKNGQEVKPKVEIKLEEPEPASLESRSNLESNPGTSTTASRSPFKIFENLQFILTSANRESGPRPFAKREVRKQIEALGGNCVETFEAMNPELTTYLIADTFYRTHKYLTALSLSLPTVSFKWINKCVEENRLVDYKDFMLDAGESDTSGEVYKWQPITGKILGGKKIAIYSQRKIFPAANPVDFRLIWTPIVVNLGAEIVKSFPTDFVRAVEYFKQKHSIDYFLADDGATPQELINAAIEGGAIAVTSEWVIQTVITGVMGTTFGDEPYVLHIK